jgi:K+-transporting ATPase ATPase C chain
MLIAQVRPACTLLATLAIITGIFYPLAMTMALQQLFPYQASGSLVQDAQGTVRGSALIGQPFRAPQWFHGRPSATGEIPCDPTASGGSNLGPTNPALAVLVRAGLGVPEKRVAVITPDRDLAQRLVAHLERWGIVGDDTAGRPLPQVSRARRPAPAARARRAAPARAPPPARSRPLAPC